MLCLAIVRRAPTGSPNAERSTAAGPAGWTTIGARTRSETKNGAEDELQRTSSRLARPATPGPGSPVDAAQTPFLFRNMRMEEKVRWLILPLILPNYARK
ncbi:hypothetical protein C7S16_4111 [Burkholderia thailandensis]|uniref:Uncharacterized protein n=1 Tax=Burkholderia thailandensis TaxID=57975 RepID=A0AAW9CYM7_BURTH|nr:hypothetical protein [Burkholderia thailandensis]